MLRVVAAVATLLAACSRGQAPAPPPLVARNLLLVTIDTLRADRVGAYGYRAARTPALDATARGGARFERAYATAPITLTSHASLLTGLYPPGHGARHNGVRVKDGVPTLATVLRSKGFATAAFVAAFPLERRFGLATGFDDYGDRLPRDARGRPVNERPGREVADEAIGWLRHEQARPFFLWVHFFEPHAPYGDPARGALRPAGERYDEEVATADHEAGRVLAALGSRARDTLVIVAGDHGEAFGEHGEVGHSLFVYDTTLRIPLILRGPGVPAGRVVVEPVTLVDIVPTAMRLLGMAPIDGDGIDLRPVLEGHAVSPREIYAESFAPLLDFGWSSLRSVRSGPWKAISAPRPELYDVERDPGEQVDVAGAAGTSGPRGLGPGGPPAGAREVLRTLLARVDGYGPAEPSASDLRASHGSDTVSRLASLGYLQGRTIPGGSRADPKDRVALAARIAEVTSGEAQGARRLALLRAIAREDPGNGQMRLRLGDALAEAGNLREAEAHFEAAMAAGIPSADAHIGLAMCLAERGRLDTALATLEAGNRIEPGNQVVQANIGLLDARLGRTDAAADALRRALALDADFHEARFNLALVLARAGRRVEAEREAAELLRRLPPTAPQRGEVERLLRALRESPRSR